MSYPFISNRTTGLLNIGSLQINGGNSALIGVTGQSLAPIIVAITNDSSFGGTGSSGSSSTLTTENAIKTQLTTNYVTNSTLSANLSGFLPLTGGTLSNNLNVNTQILTPQINVNTITPVTGSTLNMVGRNIPSVAWQALSTTNMTQTYTPQMGSASVKFLTTNVFGWYQVTADWITVSGRIVWSGKNGASNSDTLIITLPTATFPPASSGIPVLIGFMEGITRSGQLVANAFLNINLYDCPLNGFFSFLFSYLHTYICFYISLCFFFHFRSLANATNNCKLCDGWTILFYNQLSIYTVKTCV